MSSYVQQMLYRIIENHKSAEGYVNQFVVIHAISQPMREDVTTSCLIGWNYCRKSVCLLLLASHHLVLEYLWTAIDPLCGTAFEDLNFEPPGCVTKWYFISISPKTFSVFRHEIQAICYHQAIQILMFVIICRLHAFISAYQIVIQCPTWLQNYTPYLYG